MPGKDDPGHRERLQQSGLLQRAQVDRLEAELFADRPALLNADLTDAEREGLQKRVEKLHRNWKKDQDYLWPPTLGQLAETNPALVVTPPPGLEVGYVPVATRQAAEE